MDYPVIDTCVIVDMALKNRPRHDIAIKLLKYICSKNMFITIPFTTFWEFSAAIEKERKIHGNLEFDLGNLHLNLGKPIPIDGDFFVKYHKQSLPYLKAGDLILLAISKKDNLPLITEDNQLYDRAKETNVNVFRIAEYLEKYDNG